MTDQQQEIARLVLLLLDHATKSGEAEFVAALMLAIRASPSLRFLVA